MCRTVLRCFVRRGRATDQQHDYLGERHAVHRQHNPLHVIVLHEHLSREQSRRHGFSFFNTSERIDDKLRRRSDRAWHVLLRNANGIVENRRFGFCHVNAVCMQNDCRTAAGHGDNAASANKRCGKISV